MHSHPMRNERQHVFDAIGALLSGSSDTWDWYKFTSRSLQSSKLDQIRRKAAAILVPLDAKGEASLATLLVEAEQFTDGDRAKPKPWRMGVGMGCGMAVGAVLWWSGFVEGGGILQNPQLFLLPAAIGVAVVALRNRRNQVGINDPEIMTRNKQGRV